MKLRNKKTGEIVEFRYLQSDHVAPLVLTTYENDKPEMYSYNSLAELNSEWEDAPEEPKEYWFMDYGGRIKAMNDANDEEDVARKVLGNYFETKEEAELAVRKLKAWKRLKDKGFDIEGWDNHIGDNYYKTGQIVINLNNVKNRDWNEYDNISEIKDDLDLLFGGEECRKAE